MNLIATREEALPILAPYMETVGNCIRAAVEYYLTEEPLESRAWFSARTRASIIYDAMVHIARRELSVMSGVRLRDNRGYLHIVIEGRFHLRLKKLNHRLRPSSIPTQQVYEFMHQIQFEFPDAPPSLTNIIAGYKLNAMQTGIDGVYIVCPDGSDNAWEIDVEAELLARMALRPETPVTQVRARTKRTVAPKERPADHKIAGDENES